MTATSDLPTLLASLEPALQEGVFVYCAVPVEVWSDKLPAVAMIREREAITVILPEDDAIRLGLKPLMRCAWITLEIHSDLQAAGLTATFSSALAVENIPCNVIAGAYHDHIFVPHELAGRAMLALRRLQRNKG